MVHQNTTQMAVLAAAAMLVFAPPVFAQDIRGLEVCTAEKQMDRRTGCLQTNGEFLQQALDKHQRDALKRIAAADAEIAALKSRLARMEGDMAALRAKVDTAKPADKK